MNKPQHLEIAATGEVVTDSRADQNENRDTRLCELGVFPNHFADISNADLLRTKRSRIAKIRIITAGNAM